MHLFHCILLRPQPRPLIISRAIPLVDIRDLWHQRISRIGIRQQRQNAEKYLGNGECRTPLTLQNIKADISCCADIRMVDFGSERDEGRLEGIFGRKGDLEAEDTSHKGRVAGPEDHCLPGEEIIVRNGSRRAICRRIRL